MEEVTNEKGENIEALAERMNQRIINLQDKINMQRRNREEGMNQLSMAISGEVNRLYVEL